MRCTRPDSSRCHMANKAFITGEQQPPPGWSLQCDNCHKLIIFRICNFSLENCTETVGGEGVWLTRSIAWF